MEEKSRCLICGDLTINNKYCQHHQKALKTKTIKQILKNDVELIKFFTKNGCIGCPLFQTEFCNMTDEHIICENADDEIALCIKYFNKWLNSNGELKK